MTGHAQACNRQSIYCVPLYDSLGENALEFILTHAEVTFCFVQGEKLGALSKALAKVNGLVKTVVYWGSPDNAALEVSRDFISHHIVVGLQCPSLASARLGLFLPSSLSPIL